MNGISAALERVLPLLAAAVLAACVAPQVAVNSKADFSTIHRVAVATFAGTGGDQAADMLVQDLLGRGADVIERQRLDAVLHEQQLAVSGILEPATVRRIGRILGVDAIFVGTVTRFVQGQNYLVTAPGSGTVVTGALTPMQGGSFVYSQGSIPGMPDSQVIGSAATAGLIARMVDVETGSVLWSARMNYEGLDAQTALENITAAFADSLVPIWPALHAAK